MDYLSIIESAHQSHLFHFSGTSQCKFLSQHKNRPLFLIQTGQIFSYVILQIEMLFLIPDINIAVLLINSRIIDNVMTTALKAGAQMKKNSYQCRCNTDSS